MDSLAFIALVVAGITEAIRLQFPRVSGPITIVVAALVGGIIGLVDVQLGAVTDISVIEGIMAGLSAAGVTGALKKIG